MRIRFFESRNGLSMVSTVPVISMTFVLFEIGRCDQSGQLDVSLVSPT